jgi:hypothetical protein
VGIFYVRYEEKKGKITGIVSKEFLIVTGNGVYFEELINKRVTITVKSIEERVW